MALREPNATKLVASGYGYIADSIGLNSSIVPYTAFNAKKSFINKNKNVIEKFRKGINLGLKYVNEHKASEIATVIKKEFPDTDYKDLVKMIDNYKKADSWLNNIKISKEMFTNLEDIMIDNKELDSYVPYNELIYEFN